LFIDGLFKVLGGLLLFLVGIVRVILLLELLLNLLGAVFELRLLL
jgi:hypothetical protein